MKKKFVLVSLLLAAVFAITACDAAQENQVQTGERRDTWLFDEPLTVTMWIDENATFVYEQGLFLENALNEQLNVFFNIVPIQENMDERLNLALASRELPDVYFGINLERASNFGTLQGALVDLTEYFHLMPNYLAWAETMGDYPYYFYTADGALYMLPNYGYGTASNSTLWYYREDIFEELGLEVPTTDAELYEVLVAMKEAYPDSYPLTLRNWFSVFQPQFDRIGYQWGTSHDMYYCNDRQEWVYAQLDPEYRDMMEFLQKLYVEELIPPHSLSIDTAGWQELIYTNRGFIFNDFQARVDFFNAPMRQENPDVTFAYMPPFAGGSNGTTKFNPQSQLIINGPGIFVTSDNIEKIITYFDWLFTPEAELLMSWGIQGETYDYDANGNRYHIGMVPGENVFFDLIRTFGFFQRGFYCLVDPLSHTASVASPEQIYAVQRVVTDAGEYRIPGITFSEARQDRFNVLNASIKTLSDEGVGMFMTAQRPMSEWDDFLAELRAAGLEEFIKLHNDQQAEINATRSN